MAITAHVQQVYIAATPEQVWRAITDSAWTKRDFFGTVFVSRAAWPHFVKAGYGRIVNTVSEAMLGGIPELTSYGSAKGAVFGLTRNLATEGPAHGIRVNALAPRAYTRRLRRIRRRCPRFSGCRRT